MVVSQYTSVCDVAFLVNDILCCSVSQILSLVSDILCCCVPVSVVSHPLSITFSTVFTSDVSVVVIKILITENFLVLAVHHEPLAG